MLPNEHPQQGADFDCLSTAAEMLIEAQVRLEIARNRVRQCLTEVDAKGDYFMSQVEAAGLDGFEHLVAKCNGETWVIHVDLDGGSVQSVPALEIE